MSRYPFGIVFDDFVIREDLFSPADTCPEIEIGHAVGTASAVWLAQRMWAWSELCQPSRSEWRADIFYHLSFFSTHKLNCWNISIKSAALCNVSTVDITTQSLWWRVRPKSFFCLFLDGILPVFCFECIRRWKTSASAISALTCTYRTSSTQIVATNVKYQHQLFRFPPSDRPTDRPTVRSRFLNLKFFFPKYLQGKWASLSKDTHLVSNTKGWKFEIRILEQERIMWRGKKMSVTFFQCFSFPALSIELFDYENFQSMNFDESVVVDKVRWTDWF